MSGGGENAVAGRRLWLPALAVGAVVVVARLVLVAAAGNDVPFYDQWDAEGRWLYPGWREGSIGLTDLFRPHNEHRILWTHLLNLTLFAGNGGQWDPLVQLVAVAGLFALVAGMLAHLLTRKLPAVRAWPVAAAVAVMFLPFAGWHNALWGFQSQVGFALLFAGPALAWLPRPDRRWWGFACAAAAMTAMGPGLLVPAAAFLLFGLRAVEGRRLPDGWKIDGAVLAVLVAAAWFSRRTVAEHAGIESASLVDTALTWLRLLAWPHHEQPLAALVLNLPLAVVVAGRLSGKRRATAGEDVAVALGLWAALVAAAAAWGRGGGAELATGVPSRYVDFLVLLPLANLWCLLALVAETKSALVAVAAKTGPAARVGEEEPSAPAERAGDALGWFAQGRPRRRWLAAAWLAFLAVGWGGVSAEMYRRILRPLARERDRPAQLTRAFQQTGDAAVFTGRPRLFVPHPDLAVVRAVLADPRLAGALPPSLQPERPAGPLSRAVHGLLGREPAPVAPGAPARTEP